MPLLTRRAFCVLTHKATVKAIMHVNNSPVNDVAEYFVTLLNLLRFIRFI